MEPGRFFTPHQRLAIYSAGDGVCAICREPLVPGFHADHVVPFASGGLTKLENGQALCPKCNTAKGAKPAYLLPQNDLLPQHYMLPQMAAAPPASLPAQVTLPSLPLWTKPLRAWQEKGLVQWRRIRAAGRRDFLATACPAAGKTTFALRVLHDELDSGRAERIIIVVPTLTLKTQWSAAAQAFGLRLCASWGSGAVAFPSDVHGLVLTYQQVARLPEAVRIHMLRHRIVACLDEVHHGGGGLSWGDALNEAFEPAAARLSLSGTAWRSDLAPIPFTSCDQQGNSISDLDYPYAEALADGIVRETFFYTQEGQMRWADALGEHSASFADDLDVQGRSRRLRAALDTRGEWLPAVLRQAEAALREIREDHPAAKGMVACMDSVHARGVASLLAGITGEAPVVALCDDPVSADALAKFQNGPARWLVCVRMASEGFDAPNLRLIVWGTNILSELFFRQLVARAIRMVPGLRYQDALVYLPADPRLMTMAQAILSERAQALGGPQEAREDRVPGAGCQGRSLFVPLEARATDGIILSGGEAISAEALQQAQAFKRGKPALAHLPAHFIAAIFDHLEPHQLPQNPAAQLVDAATPAPEGVNVDDTVDVDDALNAVTYDDLRLRKRRNCSRLAAIVARAAGEAVETVHRACHQQLGVRQAEASLADLERKERLLVAWLQQPKRI